MERLANAWSRDGRMAPSTTSKKDLGVVIRLVTAKIESKILSFVMTVPFLRACITPLPDRGIWESLHIFLIIIDLINFLFNFLFPTVLKQKRHKIVSKNTESLTNYKELICLQQTKGADTYNSKKGCCMNGKTIWKSL